MKPPIHKFKAHDTWRRHESGWDARFYFWFYDLGEVKVFTHDGLSQKCDAFTTIETTVGDQRYIQRYNRAYHKRWLYRLASEFACNVVAHNEVGRPLE